MAQLSKACGNFIAGSILLAGGIAVSSLNFFVHGMADFIDWVFGSGRGTARKKLAWHPQRYANKPVYIPVKQGEYQDLDLEATTSNSAFHISPQELIAKTKAIIASEFGTAAGCDTSCLAEDFQFVAPIVGPLSKAEFLRAFGSFKLRDAIPDYKDNAWFQVDPLEPNRVWWFSRVTATHTGPLHFGKVVPPTGIAVQCPPQAQSMLFDEHGKCYTLTVGYTMDKRIGNTAGLGGLFAILKAVGHALPFPEGQRLYNPSMPYEAFEHVAKGVECLGRDPQTWKPLVDKRD